MTTVATLLASVAPDASSVVGPLAFVAVQGVVVGVGALGARALRSWRTPTARVASPARGRTSAGRRPSGRPHPVR